MFNSLQPHRLWSPPISGHGILQARILEWVAILFSRGASQPKDWTLVSCIADTLYSLSHQGSPKGGHSRTVINMHYRATGFPSGSVVKKKKKKSACQCRSEIKRRSVLSNSLRPHGLYSPWNSPGQNTGVGSLSWVEKIPWRRKWQPTSVFLPGKSHGQRSLAGYSPWSLKRVWHNLATKQQQNKAIVIISFELAQKWTCLSVEQKRKYITIPEVYVRICFKIKMASQMGENRIDYVIWFLKN